MSPLWLKRGDRDGPPKGEGDERRSGGERRAGKERRKSGRRDGRRSTSDLYQSDLDRHLWSWASPGTKRRRKEKSKRERRRRFAGVVASAAGALSAAGLSYFLYKRLREDEWTRRTSKISSRWPVAGRRWPTSQESGLSAILHLLVVSHRPPTTDYWPPIPMSPHYVEILQYNAFTDRPFAGNPAGVVLDASGFDDDVMSTMMSCSLSPGR